MKVPFEESGQLEAIWIKRGKLAPMDRVSRAEVVAGRGLVGNANQGGKRQITLLSAESWSEALEQLGRDVDPARRRANLLIRGLELIHCYDKILSIGDVRIRIRGETRPCDLMDRQAPGLQAALASDWRGGVYGEALDSGVLEVGAAVCWTD